MLTRLWFNQKIKLSKSEFLILIAILAVASFARYWDLGSVGFNNDEAVYSGQAATLAGYDEFAEHFGVLRAHPPLFQFVVSIVYSIVGVSDVAARSVSAGFGVMTVGVTYFLGRMLYDRKVALVAASVLALLPYHAIVTRQAMVDVPFSFFFTLTLLFMAKYALSNNRIWIYATGASAGLSFLSKEVGILTLITVIIYLQMVKKLGVRNLAYLLLTFFLVASPYIVLVLSTSESTQTGSSYLEWQFGRPPNHPAEFYIATLGGALGYVLSALTICAIIHAIKRGRTAGILLLTFVAPTFVFFQIWSTKGFHYAAPLIPALVLLGISFLFSDWMKRVPNYKILSIALIPLIFLSTNNSINYFYPPEEPIYLAGSGGLPKAREASIWIRQNTLEDSVFMVIDPTMGNIVRFYANREALALSVNPNPAQHNPAYTPITDPDSMLENGEIDYLVYDIYSAQRARYFADELNYYARKYSAEPVHTEYERYIDAEGNAVEKSVVVVYKLKQLQVQ